MPMDLRFALRQLQKQPGFALATIVVLALGIGASTAVFSVLYEALLKPLPYAQPNRIVAFHNSFPNSRVALAGVSTLDYVELRRHKEIFSETGIYYFNDLTMTGVGTARHVDPVNVSASVFRVLAVRPALGRVISDEDDRYGAPKVAVLSDQFWRATFDATPEVLGRKIQLDGEPYTIVGVMPPRFEFPYPATQLWLPMALPPAALGEMGRIDKWLQMIGRLAPGISVQQAQTASSAISHHLAQRFPAFYPEQSGWHFTIRALSAEKTAPVRVWLWLAFGAVLCVFLIACSNAGSLLLIRWTARSTELAVRAALGAGQIRLIRQILNETAVLAFAGCVAGLFAAFGIVFLFDRYGPIAHRARIEVWTAAFAVAMALISTFAAGLAPALTSVRLPIEQMLKSGVTRTAARSSGWRSVLIAGQVAAAIVLVSTATLLSRSFINLLHVPTGFSADRLWTGAVALSRNEYRTSDSALRFFQQLQDRIEALPEIESVSACTSPPFNPSGTLNVNVFFPGQPNLANQAKAEGDPVLTGYFETMKIPLLAGRTFIKEDRTRRVVIIDQQFARDYFPDRDPVGQFVSIGGEQGRPSQIIGVVSNVTNSQLGGPHSPEIYWADPEELSASMYLVVRTKGEFDPTAEVRKEIAKLDPNVALFDAASMRDRLAYSLQLRRFLAFLLNGFAFVGLLLAGIGLGGSLAHSVHLKRREIGIRMALGAVSRQIAAVVVLPAARIILVGIAAGAAAALIAGTLLRNQLFGVSAQDPLTWIAVLGAIIVTAVLAAWLPAWRAMRIEPSESLREE